ncbi:hypothetical protein CY35_07G104200 [Sphagnum magellanicum]|uniref:Uncharacterized protein n=1 Tax=Sphagnum magellanicum TaxID=128215 RepID=A0ACB8HNH8_9BRYO|nr:hypothetical protein CY35_07G104200 [Sphagnum magellanicum]
MNSKKGAARDAKSVVTDKIRKVEEKDIKKRKGALKEAKAKKPRGSKKAAKAAKDPNAPKRPPTAFFLFLNEFRKTFKEEHPDVKGVTMVGKAGGEKWKDMTDADDNDEDDATAEESDKSKSEINDDEDDEDEDEDLED